MLQREDYDCAPVAIVNAWEYIVGHPSQIQNQLYYSLMNICGTDEEGTYDAGIHRGLRWLLHNSETKVIRKKNIDYKEIVEFLKLPDQCILLNHMDYGNEPHVSMFYCVLGNRVLGENIFAGKEKDTVTLRTFKKYVESSDGLWFIRPKYRKEKWKEYYEAVSG